MVLGVIFLAWGYFSQADEEDRFVQTKTKNIILNLDGLDYSYQSEARTVDDFLQEQSLEVTDNDSVQPDLSEKILSGSRIYLQKARKIVVQEGGEEKEFYTLKKTAGQAVEEIEELNFGPDDLLQPEKETLVSDEIELVITHVEIRQEKETEKIDFKTIVNEDDEMGWREKKVTQAGVKGKKEVIYKVIYHDGEEISRKKVDEQVLESPIDEIVTQGTYIKLGKEDHSGWASWYDQTPYPNLMARYPFGEMLAANPWLPLGSYAKVTNKANDKSIIVRINDRGPFGANRIIDLNKAAFAKIASIGAGIIDVKVEEVKN